jgi:hypothetical protein
MANNRYFSNYPTINRSYLSAGSARYEMNNFDHENLVLPNRDARRSNVIIEAQSTLTFFEDRFSNAAPIPTSNYNVIKVSVDTLHDNNDDENYLILNLKQGHYAEKLSTTYSTPILTGTNFYRNYPVENEFVNIEFQNEYLANIHANVSVELSRYTQFNPPTQLQDTVKWKELANLNRDGASFDEDVALGHFQSIENVDVFGYVENANTDRMVCPIDVQPNLSNVYTEVYATSDSNLDTGEITISGDTDLSIDGRVTDGITLFGTSNSTISVNRFRSIDSVIFPFTNTGNVSIFQNGTANAVSYIPKDYARVSNCLYYVSTRSKVIVNEVKVESLSHMIDGELRISQYDKANFKKVIWSAKIHDGVQSYTWSPNLLVDSDNTIYAEISDVSLSGGNRISVSMRMKEYYLKPKLDV